MRQIVYFSTAAGRQDAATVAAIWAVSREHYQRQKLTGLLVAGGQRYLEVIEGPANRVDGLIEQIRHDPRHVGVSVLITCRITARSFADWSATYFAVPKPGAYATLGDLIERMRAMVPEQKLRGQLDCLERRFAVAEVVPGAPVASPWTMATGYRDLPFDRRH